jgi:16S rRNA (guanine527-N7)-methyltransferase
VERRRPDNPGSSTWLAERLAGPAHALGVALDAEAIERLAHYAALVIDWGERVNLTGARTREALADEHLADALALLPQLPTASFRFIDVGSGAGLPGLVLALLRPDAEGTLLEPTQKKRAFLTHAVRALTLAPRVEARAERLEAHLEAGAAGRYDVAVSRATWPAARWLELGRPLVRPGGWLLGLEGAEGGELPAGATRHVYRIGDRRRAVVRLRV